MSSFAARCGILLACRWFDAKSSALCCQTFTMRWKVGGQNHLRVAASSMAALAALARGSKSLLNFKTGCAALAATLRSKTPGSWSLAQGEVRPCAVRHHIGHKYTCTHDWRSERVWNMILLFASLCLERQRVQSGYLAHPTVFWMSLKDGQIWG